MEQLIGLLPSLSGPQLDALVGVAMAMLYSEPQRQRQYLTVAQIEEEYGTPKSSVYKAMEDGRLAYRTPNGQSKPRHARREDVEAWLGMV